MSNSPTPSPADQVKSQLSSTQFSLSNLQNKVNLTTILDDIEDIQTGIQGLPQRISNLRNNNYIFEKNLEESAADFQKKWLVIYAPLRIKINQETAALKIRN